MCIRPYRTLDNVIEGIVITFMDITKIVQTGEALQKANNLLRPVLLKYDSQHAVIVQDMEGRILRWDSGAVNLYGWPEAEALRMNLRDRVPPDQKPDALAIIEQPARSEVTRPHRTQRITKDGTVIEVLITVVALVNEAGQMDAIAMTERIAKPDSD